MSRVEFQRWMDFYEHAPFDDLHRYHRPAALVSQSLAGGKIDERLEWLEDDRSQDMGDADMNTIRAFGFKRKGGG